MTAQAKLGGLGILSMTLRAIHVDLELVLSILRFQNQLFWTIIDGGREGIRTLDLSVANAALSQLSYAPPKNQQQGSSDGVQAGARPFTDFTLSLSL